MFAPKVGVYLSYTIIIINNFRQNTHPIYIFVHEFCSGTSSTVTQPRVSSILSFLNHSPPSANGHHKPGPQQLEFARFPLHLPEWPISQFQLAGSSRLHSPSLPGTPMNTRLPNDAFSTPLHQCSRSVSVTTRINSPNQSDPSPSSISHQKSQLVKREVSPVLHLQTPLQKLYAVDSEIIDLVTPTPSPVPPNQFAKKEALPVLLFQTPLPKLQVCASEFIDLVTPTPSPVSPNRLAKKEVLPLRLQVQTPSPKLCSTEIISLVSPIHVRTKFKLEPTINLITPPSKELKRKPEPQVHAHSIGIKPMRKLSISSESNIIQFNPPPHICEDQQFASLNDAVEAVYTEEESFGHKWVKGQTKRGSGGDIRRITLRCNHYRLPTECYSTSIDPSNHRQGKSSKTDCKAHVNIIRDLESGQWMFNVPNWAHNHPPDIPSGGHASRPPTKAIRAAITAITSTTNIGRSDVSKLIQQHPEYDHKHPLEPRQISNVLNAARRTAREEVRSLGGDVNAIVTWLRAHTDEGWNYRLQIDDHQVVTGIWWQSPLQVELSRRYSDILIYDDAYNRNNVGYPLGIGIGIDNHAQSRNIWYVVHARENIPSYIWVLQAHLETTEIPPEIFASDRHLALISAVEEVLPLTRHVFCLHHLSGNVSVNVRNALGAEFSNFNRDFWAMYREISPDEFQQMYEYLISRYPAARHYLEEELYPCREQWAWAWISFVFTGGVRTNGRCEVENRVTKAIGGPKKTLFQLFQGLNERTTGQSVQEMARVRDVRISDNLSLAPSTTGYTYYPQFCNI